MNKVCLCSVVIRINDVHTLNATGERDLHSARNVTFCYSSATQHLAERTQDLTTMRRDVYVNDAQIVFLVTQVFTGLERDNELKLEASE